MRPTWSGPTCARLPGRAHSRRSPHLLQSMRAAAAAEPGSCAPAAPAPAAISIAAVIAPTVCRRMPWPPATGRFSAKAPSYKWRHRLFRHAGGVRSVRVGEERGDHLLSAFRVFRDTVANAQDLD